MTRVIKPLRDVSLDDKYDLDQEQVFITGTQAIARLLMMQHERDHRAGLNTAGFVSGYRGSPLGGLDQQLTRARKLLEPRNIVFKPGLNEELAATACWGTQQAEMRGEGRYDGVFSLWYGKGPGVDRSGDVFRHANMAGTSPHGGVLALMGDDHTAESSTTAHQSEFHFVDVMIPILNPAGVQEILDYGLYGWAMSRFCGTWVAFKGMKDTVESTAVVDGRVDRVKIVTPEFAMPPGGLNIRPRDGILDMEARLHDWKRDAMLAFVRANKINKIITSGGRAPKIGIITTGKGATGYDVNMLDVPAGATCNATVVVTHVYTGTSATATAILQVGVSINAACAWLRNPDTCAHPSGKSLQLHANSSTFVKHM